MPAKGQKRKLQIINTAKDMFIENGFQSTHIGQVCDKLEIARGTVYQYFGNKREILFAILDNVKEEIADVFDYDDLVEFFDSNPSSENLNKFLEDRMIACMKYLLAEPIVIKLIYKEISGIDDEVVVEVGKFVFDLGRIMSKDLAEIQKRGLYRSNVDPEISTHMILGGALLLVKLYGKDNRDILDPEVVKKTVDFVLNGLL